MKTDELKKRLADLIQARTHIVYFIAGLPPARQDPAYAQLAEIQAVITAFEAVIASGAEDPKIAQDAWNEKWLSSSRKGENHGDGINYNHRHVHSGYVVSGAGSDHTLTAQEMRDAIADLPDDGEIIFGPCNHGSEQHFYRFKTRGENLLSIELGSDD